MTIAIKSQQVKRDANSLAQRLRPLANAVRAMSLIGALGLLAALVWVACAPLAWLQDLSWPASMELMTLLQVDFTDATRWRLLGVTAMQMAMAGGVLWQLWHLFGRYRQGDVFGPLALLHVRRLGWSMVALAVAQPVLRALMSVAISWGNPPGKRMLQLTVGSNDYALLLLALVLVALARVMNEAARVADENEGFV
jgi:hypothetical protein